ncbi:MAG: CBS domain-containing protein [Beijerinckiaceae bacterium]
MIVANWMKPNPLTIVSDTLVSDAKQLISEKNLHALPVVDNGRLRGLVTRANLLRMGHFVSRTQNPDEFNFFITRLKVRDIMVRNPATVQSDDSMEHCMHKGQKLGVAQFPVLEGETVVGVISANEIFQLAAYCVGAWEKRNGVTLAPLKLGPGVLGRITCVVETAGANLRAIYQVGRHRTEASFEEKSIILRFDTNDMTSVVSALEAAGFPIVESHEQRHQH